MNGGSKMHLNVVVVVMVVGNDFQDWLIHLDVLGIDFKFCLYDEQINRVECVTL